MKALLLFLFVPLAAAQTPTVMTIPAQTAVNFKIQIAWDNATCVTGNTCTSVIYRATCSTPITGCPSYASSPSSYTKLSTTETQTVFSTNTHFVNIDTTSLANAVNYAYAVANIYVVNPSSPGGFTQTYITTPTGVHNATINWSNASCFTGFTCSIQVYRATCASSTSCPSYSIGSSSWKALDMTQWLTQSVSSSGTSWQYVDNDTSLVGSTTYVWVATNSYTGSSSASPASSSFSGTTTVGRSVK